MSADLTADKVITGAEQEGSDAANQPTPEPAPPVIRFDDEGTELPPEPLETEPDEINYTTLAEVRESKEETVEKPTGSDDPPPADTKDAEPVKTEKTFTQAEFDAGVKPRIDSEVKKALDAAKAEWEKEHNAKLPLGLTAEENFELVLEAKAKEYMKTNEPMNMTLEFAKDQIRNRVNMPVTAQAAKEEATAKPDVPQPMNKEEFEAQLDKEERIVQQTEPGFSWKTMFNTNPAFKAALESGATIPQANNIAKSLAPALSAKVEEGKVAGSQQAIDSIKQSNEKALIDTSGGRQTSTAKKGMTFDDVKEIDKLADEGILYAPDG